VAWVRSLQAPMVPKDYIPIIPSTDLECAIQPICVIRVVFYFDWIPAPWDGCALNLYLRMTIERAACRFRSSPVHDDRLALILYRIHCGIRIRAMLYQPLQMLRTDNIGVIFIEERASPLRLIFAAQLLRHDHGAVTERTFDLLRS